jgi:hypothetical protein
MSAHEIEEEASASKGLAAPLISICVLLIVVLGLSAYWWHLARLTACPIGHLGISLGQPQGAAGTTYMDVILTNKGAGSCSLTGYPTVFLTGDSGAALGTGAAASPTYAPGTRTLAHNSSVHAIVGFPDAADFQSGACSSASNELLIYPPGQSTSLQLPFTQYGCPGFSVSALLPGK